MSEPQEAPSVTYALLEKVGTDIFGTIWRATATEADGAIRPVLITVLDTRVSREPSFLERINKDREALEGLRNPNIGLIEAMVPVSGLPAVVTTEVVGKDLSELLADGPLPPRAAAELALELSWALHAAHGALSDSSIRPLELTHGAVLAANVRVTGAGEVVLPHYALHRAMHPNEPTATDVLALGCLLYACLTGGNPDLTANGPEDVPAAIERALAVLDPGLPIELKDLLGQCFSPNPDARPLTREVARRLRQIIPALDGAWLPTWADAKIGGAPRERPRVQEMPFRPEGDGPAERQPADASDAEEEKKRQANGGDVLRPLKKARTDVAETGPDKRQLILVFSILALVMAGAGGFALRRIWLPYFGSMNGSDVPTDQAGPDKAAAAGPVTVKRGEQGGAGEPPELTSGGGGPVTIIEEEAELVAKDEGAAPRPERELVETDKAIQPGEPDPTGAKGAAGAPQAGSAGGAAAEGLPEVGPPPWPRPEGTLGENDLFVEVSLARSVKLSCAGGLELKGSNPERVAMMQIPAGKCTVEARFPPDETATALIEVAATTDLICRLGLPGKLRCVPREAPRPPAVEARAVAAGQPVDIELRVPLARAIELSCAGSREISATMRERVMMEQAPAGPCRVKAILPDGDFTGTFEANRSKSVICLRAEKRGALRCSDAIPLP